MKNFTKKFTISLVLLVLSIGVTASAYSVDPPDIEPLSRVARLSRIMQNKDK